MPSFVANFKYALVTYSQCGDLDPWSVMELFSSLGAECIIGREHHEDGGTHLHVFVDFGRKFRSRATNVFDVDGHHPNIEPSKGTPEKGFDYAIKDGDVVCGGLGRPEPSRGGNSGVLAKWTRITGATDKQEFWDLVHELDPKSAACSFTSLSKYADWKFAVDPPCYEHPGGFDFSDGSFDGRSECKSLVMYGPSRTGKTMWARSLGAHLYCVGLLSGDECMKAEYADYAIFDDLRGGVKFFPAFKEWLGAQQYVTVKRLYHEPKLVKWGKPSIFLTNSDPRDEATGDDRDWLERNCDFIYVQEPIFHANTE
ncbi:replication associated protein [Lynx canadensis faeces associated genomovirus CL1 58]|nr:replication associated protein [Lynx canadensis faeces associated genomovirus CL1 58]